MCHGTHPDLLEPEPVPVSCSTEHEIYPAHNC